MKTKDAKDSSLDEVRRQLGYNAEREIMNARLAGLSTADLLVLHKSGSLKNAKGQWNRARMVMGIVPDRGSLFAKVMRSGLSIKEIESLVKREALTEEGLDTLNSLQERTGNPVGKRAEYERKTSGSMRERLQKASSKMV